MRAVAGPSLRPLPAPARGPGPHRPPSASLPAPNRAGVPGAPRSSSRPGRSLHCAVVGLQPPPLFVSLERRSRQRLAGEAPASPSAPRFPKASFVGYFGVLSRLSQVYNLGLWITWATELTRVFRSPFLERCRICVL